MRLFLTVTSALSLFAACGSGNRTEPEQGRPPAAAPALLLRQAAEPPGAHCAAGGTAVHAGLDADGDGLLDDAEIARTSYACGVAPAVALTRTAPEPAGASCAHGGTRVDAGRDRGGDGVLQDAEVEQTVHVCAAPAQPLPAVLSQVSLEPAGANCPFGGSAVQSGADTDGDGLLAATEVTQRAYVCESAAPLGFLVTSEEDWLLLRRASVVKGDVVVESPTLTSVSIHPDRVLGSIVVRNSPELQFLSLSHSLYPELGATVSGSLIVTDNPKLQSISFVYSYTSRQALSRVTGDLVVARNPRLFYTDLSLGGLAQVDGSIRFQDNAGLREVVLSGLRRVGGDLEISGNPALGTELSASYVGAESIGGSLRLEGAGTGAFVFGNLTTAGEIWLRGVGSRGGNIWAPALRLVTGSVTLTQNTGPVGIDAENLMAIDGDLVVTDNADLVWTGHLGRLEWVQGNVRLEANPKMTVVAFPALRAAHGLTVLGNAALADLGPGGFSSLRSLESLSRLTVADNPTLSHLHLPALRRLDNIWVATSPRLPTCEVTALLAQVPALPAGSWTGTDDGAACP